MDEREYWLGFSVVPNIGPKRFKELVSVFGSAKNAWNASVLDLKKAIGKKVSLDFDLFRSNFSITSYIKILNNKNVWFVTLEDKNYPELLKEIENPPILLYVKGEFNFNPSTPLRTIAVVGTRKITQYGKDVTVSLVQELSQAGFVIVSGLAMGVDAVAHKTAIEEDAKTIAVLGCGVDCCNPPTNQSLYNSIVKSGSCVVSEFPIGEPPNRGTFPRRNRIIAGLCLGVLVTEGASDSGALITADYAQKFNRKIFAVPGPITSQLSKGPHSLIEKGAKLVISANDILNDLKFQAPNNKSQINSKFQNHKFKTENKEERKILKALENESLGFDEIVRKTKIPAPKLASLLSIMEIKRFVKTLNNGSYSIIAS